MKVLRISLPVALSLLALTAGASAQTAKVASDDPPPLPPAQLGPAVEIGLFGFGSAMVLDNTLHAIDEKVPDPLKNKHLRLDGKGTMPGGEMRITIMPRDRFGRFRIGFDIGFGGLSSLGVASDPLAKGVTFVPQATWAARLDGFVGQEFAIGRREDVLGPGRRAWLYPYVDLRAVGTIAQTKLDLKIPGYGYAGTTTFDAYAFTVGPRAGVAIPLGGNVSFDAGGYGSFYGAERYGAYAGFTFVGP